MKQADNRQIQRVQRLERIGQVEEEQHNATYSRRNQEEQIAHATGLRQTYPREAPSALLSIRAQLRKQEAGALHTAVYMSRTSSLPP